jgi:hypothetical protein
MLRLAIVTGLVGIAAVTGADASAPSLVGRVTLQAVQPSCGKDGCAPPARSLVVRFRSPGGPVHSAKTNAKGTFSVSLPPGTYAVSTALTEDSPEAKIIPARVAIHRGRTAHITFVYRPGR